MAFIPVHFFSNKTRIDFVGTRWLGFGVSIAFTLISFFVMASYGLNWGIDFTGGMLMELRTEQDANLHKLRETLEGKGLGEVTLQNFGGDTRNVMIRIQA